MGCTLWWVGHKPWTWLWDTYMHTLRGRHPRNIPSVSSGEAPTPPLRRECTSGHQHLSCHPRPQLSRPSVGLEVQSLRLGQTHHVWIGLLKVRRWEVCTVSSAVPRRRPRLWWAGWKLTAYSDFRDALQFTKRCHGLCQWIPRPPRGLIQAQPKVTQSGRTRTRFATPSSEWPASLMVEAVARF